VTNGTCRGCGKPIVWAKNLRADGSLQNIPLDPRAPVYSVQVIGENEVRCTLVPRDNFMVSHFATCPNANDFSRGRKPR
jgi:hypothetical protein